MRGATTSAGSTSTHATDYVATLCPADFNGDGFVDGIDYDTFNNDFEAGC